MEDLAGKDCIVLMATHEDWESISYILPIIDKGLSDSGVIGHIIIVDDGSVQTEKKDSISRLKLNAIQDVELVRLGCNQGNQRAMAIGLAHIAANRTCDFLVTMDSDNEDRPEFVSTLLEKCSAISQPTVVFAKRSKRSESFSFRILYFFYRMLFQFLTGQTIMFGNFCAIPGEFVRRISFMSDLWAHFPATIMRSGIPFDSIPSVRGTRLFGSGKMNTLKLVIHAFSGFSVYADYVAARLIILVGFFAVGFIFLFSIFLFVKIFTGHAFLIPGWASVMITLFFLIFTILLGSALTILMLTLSLKSRPSLIPLLDYQRYVDEITTLYPLQSSDS